MAQVHEHAPAAFTDKAIPGTEKEAVDAAAPHNHDVTVIMGRTLPFPVYTVVFGILAAITIVEVIISELPEGTIGNILLIVLSLIKAVLVVAFYMHLREESPLYTAILVVPVVLVVIATLFLTSVPLGNY
ncbi:MAG: cytochrome C oxidase subunit IV family protein [Chloroflexota bacterium]|nr:cytochrome C oxidase subunit IV family protein [Chloroflexota bacterium]